MRAAVAAALLPLDAFAATTTAPVVAGCRVARAGRYVLSVVDAASGVSRFDLELPGRGHDVIHHARRGELIAFARRPGAFIAVADIATGLWTHRIGAAAGRHFYGHGALSGDGRWLFATENAFDTGRGVVGVYDVHAGYQRVDEFDSHGTGPHELLRLPGSDVLAVANGGLRTHPDFPREILNRDDMRPNLALLDMASGRALAIARAPHDWRQLSVRHLATDAGGRLCIGMQYQGPRDRRPPLVAFSDGDSFELAPAPPGVLERMRNYCGSVKWLDAAGCFAVTSPHEGIITTWSINDGFVAAIDVAPETSAVSAVENGRVLLAGAANALQRLRFPADVEVSRLAEDFLWDNHMLAL